MLPLLVSCGWSRFLRCVSFLSVLCALCFLPVSASAQTIWLKLRIDNPYTGGYVADGLTWKGIVRFDPSCAPGQYYVFPATGSSFFGVVKTAPVGTGQDVTQFQRNVATGAALGSLITTNGGTVTEISFEPGRAVHRVGGVDTNVPFYKTGSRVWGRQDVVGPKPHAPGEMITHNYVMTIGGSGPCPPRDLTFAIDLGIEAAPHKSHNVALSLVINDGAPMEIVPPYIAKGSATLDISMNVPNVPGAFTYKWLFNGTVVASGMYGCGDEIPFNRVADIATVTAEALPDQDGDGDPDVTDPDIDGDNIPNEKEGEIITTPEPGTNAGPGAPQGSEGNPIPKPGTTVGTGVGNGTGTPGENGNVNVLNVKDFQDAFKWAFENAGNNNGYFAAPGNGQTPYNGVGWTDPAPGELSTAGIDAAKGALEDAEEAGELLKGDASAVVTAMASHKPNISGQPVPNGVWRFNLGNIGLQSFGQNYFDVDIRPFSSAVSAFRSICSWVLLVLAWFKFWNFFRSIVPA